jgi:hypothetical protein
MHLKVVIADQQITTTGSFNFSKAAATINDEVLMVIKNPDVAKSFTAEFESMWQDTKGFASISPKIASAGSVPVPPAAESEKLSGSCSVKMIKGNPDSMLYHVPGQKYYDTLDQPVLFCSEASAQAAGYRKSKV